MDKLFSWDKIHLHWFQQSASLESYYIIRTSLRVYIGFLIAQFLICTKSSWIYHFNLRKQPTFQDATTGFPTEWRLRNKCRNSILMMCHYPGLGSDSDWSYCKGICFKQSEALYHDLGSDTSSVWNFCSRPWNVILFSIDKWYPFHIPSLEICFPFNCCKCAVF